MTGGAPPPAAAGEAMERRGSHPPDDAHAHDARDARLLSTVALIAVILFALLGVGKALLGLETFNGSDLLLQYAPYRELVPDGFVQQRPCVSDTVDNVLPASTEFRRRLLGGDFAQWDALAGGGAPLGAVPSFAVLSPFSLPAIVLSPWLAPAYVKLLEILGGAFGTYLFLRRVGLVKAAAWLGGLLFTSSGFLVVWTNWPQTRTASVIPWLFWAVERFLQRRRAVDAIPIALAVAALLVGGFPSVAGYALYALVPYLAVRAVVLARGWMDATRRTLVGGAFIGLGGLLVAFQLLPFASQLSGLGLDRRQRPSLHLPITSVITTAVPQVYGSCGARPGWFGPYNQVELIAFIGAAALVLVGVALLRGPSAHVERGVRGYFAGAAFMTFVLGYYGGLPLRLAQKLPVFSNNPVLRIRSVFGFFLAVLAAVGFDRLVRDHETSRARRRVRTEIVAWMVILAASAALAWRIHSTYHDDPGYRARVWIVPIAALAVALGAVVVVSMPSTNRRRWLRVGALALVPAVVLVESLVFARGFWPRQDRRLFYPVTSVQRYIAARDGDGARYAATGNTMFPGTNVYYGLATPNGHGFTDPRWMDLLRTVDPTVMKTPTFTQFRSRLPVQRVDSPILDRLGVRWMITDPSDPLYGPLDPQPTEDFTRQVALRPGETVDVALGPAALRGVAVRVNAIVRSAPASWLRVDLLDADGRLVTSNRRRFDSTFAAGWYLVALTGESADGRPRTARVSVEGVAEVRLATDGQRPLVRLSRAADDGLRLVFAAGANVWERLDALPRVRWATTVVTAPGTTQRLTYLANVRDPQSVVLDAPVPAISGRAARVRVIDGDADRRRIAVDADGSGYLVVADSLTEGWRATLDGRTVPIVRADHALAAVRVEAGRHVVVLEYRPPGQRLGLALSGVDGAFLVGLALAARRTRRRSRAPGP